MPGKLKIEFESVYNGGGEFYGISAKCYSVSKSLDGENKIALKGIKMKEVRIQQSDFQAAVYQFRSSKTDYCNLSYKPQIGKISLQEVQKPIFNILYTP